MKRVISTILFVAYSIIAITVTVLLLSFNEYNCSEIGDYTIYLVNDDALDPEYNQGSILLIKSTSDKHVKEGDEIFLYKVINSSEYEIVTRTLVQKTQQGSHIVYTVNGGENYASDYFIGKADEVTVVESPWGTILSILESKWGYLFCIVIVSLLLFLQEVFELIIELKYGGTKGTKAANVANARKATKKAGTAKKPATAKKTTTTAAKSATTKNAAPKSATATKTVEKPVDKAVATDEGSKPEAGE